jgi:hypothetical protein
MLTVPLYPHVVLIILYTLLCLWLITPTLLYGNQIKMIEDIYKGNNALLDSLVNIAGDRDNMPEFMKLVRQIESGGKYRPELGKTDFPFGNPKAEASTSTAAGVYQFTNESVKTAKKRATNIGIDPGFINLIPNDPRQWTDQEADIMFLGNMFASIVDPDNPKASKSNMYSGLKGKPGLVDSLLSEAFKPNNPSINAMEDLYNTIQHTDPDEATKTRAKQIFK